MENMRSAPTLPPATAAFPKSHPFSWGSGHAGKPHKAAIFIVRTKAVATLAVLCPRSAFAIALGHSAFNSKHVTRVQDLLVEGASAVIQKYLQKTSSDCNKHKQQTRWAVLLYKTHTWRELKSQANLERKKKCLPKEIPMTESSCATGRVEVTPGLDVVHAHCTQLPWSQIRSKHTWAWKAFLCTNSGPACER